MFKVSQEIIDKLLKLPETGMGYQVVDATFSDRRSRETLIINSTLAEPTKGRRVNEIFRSMSSQDANRMMKFGAVSTEIIDVKIKAGSTIFKEALSSADSSAEKGALDSPVGFTEEKELFTRLSHFEDDKRVDIINNKLLPGSFATTYLDWLYCKKNDNAIERYALPNNLEIKYAFQIMTKKYIYIQRGTVQPANDKRGGGKEVYFKEGTNNTSLYKTEEL